MLLLVSIGDDLDIHGDPETIWRPWVAGELRSRPIHSGHHQAAHHPTEDNGSAGWNAESNRCR
jgi:haloacetate dehalogenase